MEDLCPAGRAMPGSITVLCWVALGSIGGWTEGRWIRSGTERRNGYRKTANRANKNKQNSEWMVREPVHRRIARGTGQLRGSNFKGVWFVFPSGLAMGWDCVPTGRSCLVSMGDRTVLCFECSHSTVLYWKILSVRDKSFVIGWLLCCP